MTQGPKKIYGLILAGGYSKRMGQDKALLEFHGKPQVTYCYDLLTRFCGKVFVSARPDQKYFDLPMLNDHEKFSNKGPLGGILSAMTTYPEASWILLACDLPYVTAATMEHLIENRKITSIATAFISAKDGLPEPLCAIWEDHAQIRILELFHQGIKCPRKILINSDTHLITLPFDHWLDNINSPEDLKRCSKETFP